MVAWWAKKKSVTFTSDSADQNLLADIEQVLAEHQYENFSDLCKQALWQFLAQSELVQPSYNSPELLSQMAQAKLPSVNTGAGEVSSQSSVTNQPDAKYIAELQQKITELEQKLQRTQSPEESVGSQSVNELQRQFVELKNYVDTAESRRLAQLEHQLNQLTQKFQELLEMKVNQELMEKPVGKINPSIPKNPEPQEYPPAPASDDDVLKRIGSMLDSF